MEIKSVGCLGGFLFGPLRIVLALVTLPDQAALGRKERDLEAQRLARGELIKCPLENSKVGVS